MKLANGNYVRPTARFSWWLSKKNYFSYMMRELSSLFIGIFSLIMVWGLYQFSQGEAAYNAWSNNLWSNLTVLSVLSFCFAVYHSFTWFVVTPKAMPLKFAGKRIPGSIIIAAHMLLWMGATIFVWVAFVYGGEL
ncbi:MAG: fumarate reductase subunit C [Gammaproteobacteria bacterium]|nr:MAG: fumarate reductase subunit C [Gammaproteobacteria bacterium]